MSNIYCTGNFFIMCKIEMIMYIIRGCNENSLSYCIMYDCRVGKSTFSSLHHPRRRETPISNDQTEGHREHHISSESLCQAASAEVWLSPISAGQ